MTKEEKVIYLMRLAVDTHSAYRSAQIASGKGMNTDHDPIEAIEKIYNKYEALLDKNSLSELGRDLSIISITTRKLLGVGLSPLDKSSLFKTTRI